MRLRILPAAALAVALALASVRPSHSMGTKPDPTPTPPSPGMPTPSTSSGTEVSGARQEAERAYALAYDDLAKAKQDEASGNAKNAQKKYKKALERVENAVSLDSTYAEAWNLVGYASRKLGDYDKSFAAYDKCLAIKPDLMAAHEYLGEAYLEKGQLDKAHEQLAILVQANPESEESKALNAAISSYVAAHP
jgi:tetratricopeptide (TPR) repeat protein